MDTAPESYKVAVLVAWLGHTESIDFRVKDLKAARDAVHLMVTAFPFKQHLNISIQMGGMVYYAEGDRAHIAECMHNRGLVKSLLNTDQWEIM